MVTGGTFMWVIFSNVWFLLVLIAMVSYRRLILAKHLITLLLLAGCLAPLLKSIWQVPLAPGLGDHSWAFPSGHMMTATMFWLYFCRELIGDNIRSYVCLLCMLGWDSWAMYEHGYHHWDDLLAGFVFGGLAVFIYGYVSRYAFKLYIAMACLSFFLFWWLSKTFVMLLLVAGVSIVMAIVEKSRFSNSHYQNQN